MATPTYVVVTPAKDEEAFIGETIDSMINQTVRPVEWIIVSDGSTDRTDEIAQAASLAYPWIRLLTRPRRTTRDWAAVVHATETGVSAVATKEYEYIGLIDADVRLPHDYFERVIDDFERSPSLGLAGGLVIDPGEDKDRLPTNRSDVSGAVQVFRRTCFEALGGLLAIPEGGWDALTCVRARMLGYQTRLLTDLTVAHLKPRNIAEGGVLRRRWQTGTRDYALGYHPLYELVKCLSRITDSPRVLSSAAWWMGYCSAAVRRRRRLVPAELVAFLRAEQVRRLRRLGRTSWL
jgi:biofilm PGA synthesis N-glycosyltransferase PgaC